MQAFHIFKYLDIHKDRNLAFNPAIYKLSDHITIDRKIKQMKKKYPDVVKYLTPNDPPPRGKLIHVSCFVDSNHTCDKIKSCCQYVIIIYYNKTQILWYSKKQDTVESSTFGSEFVAKRVAPELIISLRYKLWMFGIPISVHVDVFCDN